jgi:hypothetical protein
MTETGVYKTERGTIFRIRETDEGHISVELLKAAAWVAGPIGMAGLRVARATTKMTQRQVQALPS